ncbi:unnamed protein product [Dovyalis caffra]|uniref:Uncharacterized protein n=1 Tax=Dovyalis caffra TaxID=77055 RepID=A0AAV1RFI3_9ROSI|nr:unnamed protein product [Dovyalis caffra]
MEPTRLFLPRSNPSSFPKFPIFKGIEPTRDDISKRIGIHDQVRRSLKLQSVEGMVPKRPLWDMFKTTRFLRLPNFGGIELDIEL